jgi:hypothetical protein
MSSDQARSTYDSSTKGAAAAGVARFAGVMLAVVAVFEILQGIAAIANDSVFVRGVNYTYKLDVTAWGWIHLLIGVVSLGIGIAIVIGNTLGYLGGIAVAFLGAVANFAFLPYYPLWSLLVIAFNVLVIWALCVQIGGDRVDEDYYARQDAGSGSAASAPSGTAPSGTSPSGTSPSGTSPSGTSPSGTSAQQPPTYSSGPPPSVQQ